MNKESLKSYSLILLGALALIIIVALAFKFIFPVMLPFFLALILGNLTRTPAERISGQGKIPVKIVRLLLSLFLTLAVFGILSLLLWRATVALWHFLESFGEGNRLFELIVSITDADSSFLGISLPSELSGAIHDAVDGLLSTALSSVAEWVSAVALAVPKMLFFLLILVISLIYVALDLDRINGFLYSLLPKKAGEWVIKMRDGVFLTVKKYIVSYILLSLVTFFIISVGFLILRVKNALLFALVLTALDILPVIGVGALLLPWGIFEIATGNLTLGVGLVLLFLINAVVRQLLEPKIIGKSLGLHPVATIIMLYAGYRLFGIGGLLLVPIVSLVIGVFLDKNKSTEVA